MQKPSSRRSGFTLVELSISVAIMGMMMGFIFMIQSTGQGVASQATLQDEGDARLTRVLERVTDELRFIIDTSIWENLDGAGVSSGILTYQAVVSLEGGVALPGPVMRVELLTEPGEQIDDVDNDGDGLIDERALYLTRDLGGADEKRVLLCRGVREYYDGETLDLADDNGNGLVDEPGFHIVRDGDRLVVRLTVEVARSDGARVLRSGEASIQIRN